MQDRGPGESYRPDDIAPSVFAVHQPGIATPVLDHLVIAALDVTAEHSFDLHELMGELTLEAERLMRAGHRHGNAGPAGALTVTLGLGPALFGPRFGLTARRPAGLVELPSFPGDALSPAISAGDLCVGSAIFAVPPGTTAGHGLAHDLLAT